MSKDDYVTVILGTFIFVVWATIGFIHWLGHETALHPSRPGRKARER
jgi:hypothetical protein